MWVGPLRPVLDVQRRWQTLHARTGGKPPTHIPRAALERNAPSARNARMTTTTRPQRQHMREALERIQRVLTDAAGADKRLSKRELADTLESLAPTERAAVDAFARVLETNRKPRGVITVRDIEAAIVAAKTTLSAPAGAAESTQPLDDATLEQARTFGEGLVGLAARFAGEPGAVLPPFDPRDFAGLDGAELLQVIRERALPHVAYTYGSARDVMFGAIDNQGGKIVDVYRGRVVPLTDRNTLNNVHQMNTEHTHPQSQGIEGTPARTDLHHLFPTDAEANGKRSSLPFGDVVGAPVWEKDGAKLGNNAEGDLVFEPPLAHKGDAARALFYIAAVYGLPIPPHEEAALKRWHTLDPVDGRERARNDAISARQENRNPFVDVPGLVDRLDDI
jgi:deoxyribonuclease I